MKLSKAILGGLGVLASLQGANTLYDHLELHGRTIQSCEDIPVPATLDGELTFAGHIDCEGDLKVCEMRLRGCACSSHVLYVANLLGRSVKQTQEEVHTPLPVDTSRQRL